MSELVWLIADGETNEVSYIRHGKDGDEANWRTIGPFAYSDHDEAVRSAEHPSFFPEGVTGEFCVIEIPASSFVQAIFNGFPPSQTDVFALNGGLLPLSDRGATWIDEAQEAHVWEPLFDQDGDGDGLRWLDTVLGLVSERLGMDRQTIDAIGSMNAAEQDVDDQISRATQLIQEHVRVAIVPEPGTVALNEDEDGHELSSEARFWLHTNGLSTLGRPELEIRNVPCWWVTAAGAELHGWAAYSLEHGIEDGQLLDGGGPVPLQIEAKASEDEHWSGKTCLRLTVKRVMLKRGLKQRPAVETLSLTQH